MQSLAREWGRLFVVPVPSCNGKGERIGLLPVGVEAWELREEARGL